MKKFVSISLGILIMFLLSFTAQAGMKLVYDGKTHVYNEKPVGIVVNGEKLSPPMPPILLNGRTVVPARAVFEKLGASVEWKANTQQVFIKSPLTNIILKINSSNASVNGSQVRTDMPAKIINGSTMIPIRFVSEQLGMKVVWNSGTRLVTIDKRQNEDLEIKRVLVSSESGRVLVKVEASGAITSYDKLELESPERLVIDIPDSIINPEQCNLVVNNGNIERIRAAQHDTPKKSRIVLDLVKKTGYQISLSEDKKQLIVGLGTQEGNDTGNIDTPVDIDTGDTDDFEQLNLTLGETNKISLDEQEDKTCVCIQIDSSQNYTVSRISDYDAIAVDITDTSFSNQSFKIPVSDENIKYLESKKLLNNIGRIIIGVEGQPQYQVFQEPGKISIFIFKPSYRNIKYTNSKDVSNIIIDSSHVWSQISAREDFENKKVIFLIPEGVIDLGTGVMHINDQLVSSIEIAQQPYQGTEVTVQYNFDGRLYYKIGTDQNGKTSIEMSLKEQQAVVPSGNFLVVIDAGHGGYDPGAKYGNQVLEKEINLDIALRLNKLLKDSGVETVMTREKDVFVELRERANIANKLNADLFVSIHNNWIGIPSVSGTETLYYPSSESINGLTGKVFAQLVQDELIRSLGTVNRKIVPRPNLVVLNSTKMPAVLAEIGFISNKSERKKLMSDSFRQNAAEGLHNAILKALNKVKK